VERGILLRLREAHRKRQLGLSTGQMGIYTRYLNEGYSWEKHLQNSRKAILDAVSSLKPKSICIMGSGLLLDVPVNELLQLKVKLTLVDIAHPPQIVKKYEGNPLIKFETVDLTGGLVLFLQRAKLKDINFFTLSNKVLSSEPYNADADLVVSLNLLSQLSDIPLEFLKRKKKLADWQYVELAGAIQQKHVDSLPKGKSVLITDIMEEFYDDRGSLIATRPNVFIDLSMLKGVQEWLWNFDTTKSYNEEAVTKLRVVSGIIA